MFKRRSNVLLDAQTRGVVGLKIAVALMIAAGFYWHDGQWHAISALYGGMVSIISALLLSHGIQKVSCPEHTHQEQTHQVHQQVSGEITLYLGAALRFVLLAVLFWLGMGKLKLEPVPLVVCFGLAQLAYVVNINRK